MDEPIVTNVRFWVDDKGRLQEEKTIEFEQVVFMDIPEEKE